MHPILTQELAKLHQAELRAEADQARLARRAAAGATAPKSDPIRFRQRVARLFGPGWPSAKKESTRPAGA